MDASTLLSAGLTAVFKYLSAHVLTCLVPAFFIAGAMSALLPKEKIIKHLGADAPKYKAYPLSVAAGLVLAVCSCTILPLFAGIKKKGAGIGPALAFLYTAPATNILAITFTGSVLGWDFAAARIILSVIFATFIGLIISGIFREDVGGEKSATVVGEVADANAPRQSRLMRGRLLLFFATLAGILIAGTRLKGDAQTLVLAVLLMALVAVTKMLFSRDEVDSWLAETWIFFKKIFPLLVAGIFIAGILTALIPKNYLAERMGESTVASNLIAVLFGVFMYFPTLVEVPMARMFLDLGMAKGPLLAYLLADPVISLPSILVVRGLLGNKRTLAYVGLIILFTTLSGLIYGSLAQ